MQRSAARYRFSKRSGAASSRIAPSLRGVLLFCFSALLLSACGGGYAPVSDRSLGKETRTGRSTVTQNRSVRTISPAPTSGYYRVRKGDTLYSIAFRYGKDFRALARANGIASHYRIYPGQRIKLAEAPPASTAVARKSSTAAVKKADSTRSTASRTSASASATVSQRRAATQSVSSKASKPPASTKISWRWPAKGKLLQRFQSKGNLNKGLNIATRIGDPVFAAASGSVVYAGSGLLGYGNLVIINHNQQYLSAYAHNRRILVKERDRVKKGEKIAESGNSGTTRSMLHFEIRKDGKPVNPLYYLPKR